MSRALRHSIYFFLALRASTRSPPLYVLHHIFSTEFEANTEASHYIYI